MLEYLGYGLFGVVMIACLLYIMNALETDDPPAPKQPDQKKLRGDKSAIRQK